MNIADKLVTEGLGVSDVTIVRVKRLLNKVDPTKPGLLKLKVTDCLTRNDCSTITKTELIEMFM